MLVAKMTKYVSGEKTDEWLPKHWRKTTLPILQKQDSGQLKIVGSAFLIYQTGRVFIVSAKHVIDDDDLVVALHTKEKKIHLIPINSFEDLGARWVHHPACLDLAAIPFPDSILEKLDVKIFGEDHWVPQDTISKGSRIVHLGFPEGHHVNYENGTSALGPIGMPGTIIGFQGVSIQMKSDGAPGASGGPVIIDREGSPPLLIGVATTYVLRGQSTRPEEGEPLHITSALPINLIRVILESQTMETQCIRLGFPPTSKSLNNTK